MIIFISIWYEWKLLQPAGFRILCVVYQWRNDNTCVYKDIYLFSLWSRNGWNIARCEREIETKDPDCYDWYHIFLTHVVVLYSEPHFTFASQPGVTATPVGGVQGGFCSDCPLLLTDHLPWGKLKLCVPTANLRSLYKIHNSHAFFFRLPIYVIHFHCSLVHTGVSPV